MGDYVQLLFNIIDAYENKSAEILSMLRKMICDAYHTKSPVSTSTLTYTQYESLCSVCDIFLDAINGGNNEDMA